MSWLKIYDGFDYDNRRVNSDQIESIYVDSNSIPQYWVEAVSANYDSGGSRPAYRVGPVRTTEVSAIADLEALFQATA